MASTYSTNLAIELIGTGEQSGTWGTTTNTNLGTLIEQSISGYVTQAITDGSGANTTITIPNGATGVARNMFIEMTGALTFSTTSLIVPANKKMYFIFNNTTGGFAVTVKVSGQTGILVPNGKKVVLTSNGTDIVEAHTAIVGNATMGGTLGITGTTTAAAINASGLVAMAAAATIGTTLAVTGTTTAAAINASGLIAGSAGLASGGNTNPSSGTNIEVRTNGTTGIVLHYDRTGSAYKNLTLSGSDIALAVGGTNKWTMDASGNVINSGTLGVTGASTLTGNVGIGVSPSFGLHVSKSVAADVISVIANTSATGFGLKISAGSSGKYALLVRNYTESSDLLTVDGAGGVSIPYVWANTGGTTAVMVDSAGTLFKLASARKYKMDITPYSKGLADVLKLDPQYYRVKSQGEDSHIYAGLIADDLDAQGLSEFVAYGPEGVDSINYGHMAALFANAIKELAADFQSYKSSHP